MLSAPVLILKSFSFYTDSVVSVLKTQLQGMAHIFDWEGSAKGDPERFYSDLWSKVKDKYLAVVVLGEKPLEFATRHIKEKPVIYIQNYHNMDTTFLPDNFVGIYGSISPALHLEKLICAVKEAKILGILIHRSEWEILKDLFRYTPNIYGENPINEIHIRLIDHPPQLQGALKDFMDFGVKVVWIPPTSKLNYGKYLENIIKFSVKYGIGITSSDISYVRVWALYSWQPSQNDMGNLILETLYEIDKLSKEKGKTNLPRIKISYIFSSSSGIPVFNFSLARKYKFTTSENCYFKETY